MERHDAALAALAAVQSDVIRPKTRRKAGSEQEVGVEARDVQKYRSSALVPEERDVSVDLLHAGSAILDRCGAPGLRRGVGSCSAATLPSRRGVRVERPRPMSRRHQDDEGEYCAESNGSF